jgi:uncharacterized membrane protein
MNALRPLSLMAATIAMGLAAGVFDVYAHTVMPGLHKTDDRTFVAAFQAIDRAIINPWFIGGCFIGAFVLAVAALIAFVGRAALPWIAVGIALYLVAVVITFAVHVPLNDAIKAAGDPDRISDLAAVRARFDEARWVSWNVVRAVAATGGFACLAWALVLSGRTPA